MSTIVTRSGKGSPLTNNEIDANFNNLNSDKLETGSLSVNTNSAGTAGLAYSSNVFTYTPPNLAVFATLSGAAFTGAITTNSTFDGRDVGTDGSKLDNIEANADVTDATNVTAAGALMDSEVTNLAQVKAFASSDYATAAQGVKADAALANIVEDTSPQLGGDLDSQGKDITDVGILSADAVAGIYGSSSAPVVFAVTVGSKTAGHPYNGDGSGSAYFLNGVEAPAIKFSGADNVTSSTGYYYKFDQSNSSNSGHPLLFYYDAAKTTAFTTGVTTSGTAGNAGAHTTIAVTADTPNIVYYECTAHAYMGNVATAITTTIGTTAALKVPSGTTGQRPSGVAGQFRYSTTLGKFEGYTDAWGEIGGGAADLKLNSFTGNGSTVAYTLSSNPVEDNTLVYVDGVYQNKTGYAIVNNVLTFSEAPANSSAIEITAATIAPVEASTEFKISQFTGNGSTTAYTLSAQTPENNTSVYWDGVYQSKSNYSVSGTTLTFSTAPPNGVAVEVMAAHAVIVSVSTPDDNTVSTVKIVNNAVTTAKILDANVTTAKIADDAITAAKIADNSVDIARLNVTDGTAGQSLTTNGSGTLAFATIGGAFNDFAIKTGNYTAVTKDQLIVNSGSAVTITLPASPAAGNVVFIKNAGAGTVTVARNGSKINSQTQDGTLAADAAATLVFVDATIGYKEL